MIPSDQHNSLECRASDWRAICDDVRLDAAVSSRQLPRRHATWGKASHLILKVDAAHANHIHLVCRVIQSAARKNNHDDVDIVDCDTVHCDTVDCDTVDCDAVDCDILQW